MHPLPVSISRLAALLATLTAPALAGAAAPPADLELHGTRLRATCRADAWPASQAALEQAAGGRDAAQLVTLLRAYLCDEGAAAASLVRRHAPPHLLQRSEGTGEKPLSRRVAAAEALAPRAGQVYELQVRRAAPARITLHWQADEACVQGVVLVHRSAAWGFVETSAACD